MKSALFLAVSAVLTLTMSVPAEAVYADHAKSFMAQAEAMFGPRDQSFTIAEPVADRQDFPITLTSGKVVSIHLTTSTNKYIDQGYFQLAHEIVHALSPRASGANMLEEGAAEYFSVVAPDYSPGYRKAAEDSIIGDHQRSRSYKLVSRLETAHPGTLKRLRAAAGSFRAVRADMLVGYTSKEDATYLLGFNW